MKRTCFDMLDTMMQAATMKCRNRIGTANERDIMLTRAADDHQIPMVSENMDKSVMTIGMIK